MPILVCGISAFEFWRSRRNRDSPGIPGTPVPHLTQFGKPTREEVLEARRVLGLAEGDELHVLVGCDPGRRHFSSYVCHLRSAKDWLCGDSLMQIGRGIWVVSPELLFLEASGTLERIDLIRLGMELCSLYCMPDPSDRGRLELRDHPPYQHVANGGLSRRRRSRVRKDQGSGSGVLANRRSRLPQRGFARAVAFAPDQTRRF